jgi:serine/threonine protein kinase
LHQSGLLHCDIRPKNILIDEYGILKISDFKMARKIPKTIIANASMENRGTPQYMAPELFSPSGVHSYSTDFWALACTLYQLRKGHVPFMPGKETSSGSAMNSPLVDSICHYDPFAKSKDTKKKDASSDVSMSPMLSDLLAWMLEKSPLYRCDWYADTLHRTALH